MELRLVKALKDTYGRDITGNTVKMSTGSVHLVAAEDLPYYMDKPTHFMVYDNGEIVTYDLDANGNVVGFMRPDGTTFSITVPEDLVTSVNGTQGVVVLTSDDISDAADTKKFTTAAEKAALAAAVGTDIPALQAGLAAAVSVNGTQTTDIAALTAALAAKFTNSLAAGSLAGNSTAGAAPIEPITPVGGLALASGQLIAATPILTTEVYNGGYVIHATIVGGSGVSATDGYVSDTGLVQNIAQATVFLNNGSGAIAVQSVSGADVSEGEIASVLVTLNAQTTQPTSFDLLFSGSAQLNNNYNTITATNGVIVSSNTINVPAGVRVFNLDIQTIASASTGVETLVLTIDGVSATVYIQDQPQSEVPAVVSSVSSATITEGTNAVLTVTLSKDAIGTEQFSFSTAGTAGVGDTGSITFSNGVTNNAGALSIPLGVTSFTVTVQTIDDANIESSETFSITVAGVTGTITILDNDTAVVPTLSIVGNTVNESALSMQFTVNISEASPVGVTVQYATSDGTATAGTDYTTTSGTLTWAIGDASPKFITVPILNTNPGESNEDFTVTLTSPTNATIATANATGTIIDSAGVASFMDVGMNISGGSYWSDNNVFINIAHQMTRWLGSNNATVPPQVTSQRNGKLVLNPALGSVKALIATRMAGNPDMTLAGDYIVRAKGDGGVIGITEAVATVTNVANQIPLTGTKQTVLTFTYTPSNTVNQNLYVTYGGGNGVDELEIIKVSDVALYDTGCQWKQAFMDYIASTCKLIRPMDSVLASGNLEMNWADRAVLTDPRWHRVPWEALFDLSVRTNVPLHINVPHRASAGYCQSLGTLINNHPLVTYIELPGNETWNLAAGFHAGNAWCRAYSLVKTEGTINSDGSIYSVGHGLVENQTVMCFDSSVDYANDIDETSDYPLGRGITNFVMAKDADNFWIKRNQADTTPTIPHDSRTRMLWASGAGVTGDYGHARIFVDQANAILVTAARNKCKFLMGSQSINSGVTTGRLNALSAGERTSLVDYISLAPYSQGVGFGARVISDNGSATIGIGQYTSSTSEINMYYYGIYPAAANPTNADVVAGTGAIQAASWVPTSTTGAYVNMPAITGLALDTSYKAIVVAYHDKDIVGESLNQEMYYRIEVPFTMAASAQTQYGSMTHAEKLKADMHHIYGMYRQNLDHQTVMMGIPHLAYEAGHHYDQLAAYNASPGSADTLHNWLKGYLNSITGKEWAKRLYYTYAKLGWKAANWYKHRSLSPFGLTNYMIQPSAIESGMTEFGGQVPVYNNYPTLTTTSYDIPTAPGSYPYTVGNLLDTSGSNTLDSGTLTYEIVSGNDDGMFSIVSGNQLRMNHGTGINFNTLSSRRLLIQATNAAYSAFTHILLNIGSVNFANITDMVIRNASGGYTNPGEQPTFTFNVSYDYFRLDLHKAQTSEPGSPVLAPVVQPGQSIRLKFKVYGANAGALTLTPYTKTSTGSTITPEPLVKTSSTLNAPASAFGAESQWTWQNQSASPIELNQQMGVRFLLNAGITAPSQMSFKDMYLELL